MVSFLWNMLATVTMYTRLDRFAWIERIVCDGCEKHCRGKHRDEPMF